MTKGLYYDAEFASMYNRLKQSPDPKAAARELIKELTQKPQGQYSTAQLHAAQRILSNA